MSDEIRVLIVEDDPFLAIDLEDTFEAAGFRLSGTAASVAQGLSLIDTERPDVATLDYHLGRETSEPIAALLRERNIPYCYISGHASRLPHDAPVISKPVAPHSVVRIVEQLVAAQA